MEVVKLWRWRYTETRSGRRRTTRHRLTEDDARAQLVDPERIEFSLLTLEPQPHGEGWCGPSGLVRRDDGVLMPASGPPESLKH
jgi:hypothetical protein